MDPTVHIAVPDGNAYLDPHILIVLQTINNRNHAVAPYAVLFEDSIYLFFFRLGHLTDLAVLALLFNLKVFLLCLCGEPGAKTHRDGACEEFCNAADDNDVG